MFRSAYFRWVDGKVLVFVANLCTKLSTDYKVHVLAPHCKGSKLYEEFDDIKSVRFMYFYSS